MKSPVIIKSSRYGINLMLDPYMEFSALMQEIEKKFIESKKFFRDAKLAISFEGRQLTSDEELAIINRIQELLSVEIICIIDPSEVASQYYQTRIEEAKLFAKAADIASRVILKDETGEESEATEFASIYRGSVKAGKSLRCDTNLLILGDVEEDAAVISAGNIIILGSLMGSAHAGSYGSRHEYVIAKEMQAKSIRIGSIQGKDGGKGLFGLGKKKKSKDAYMIASLEEDGVVIRELDDPAAASIWQKEED